MFYYRNGCHLCEELAAVLFRAWPSVTAAIEWRDVDTSPDWRHRYGTKVPVLIHDDELVCELEADFRRLGECFGEPENPL